MSKHAHDDDTPPNTDIVTLLDAAGTVLHLSASVTAELGYTPAELIGTPLADIIHPDDRAEAAALFAACETGTLPAAVGEWRYRRRDGTWRQLQVVGHALPAAAGAARALLLIRDITDRRRHAERLRLLESVATHANDAILITEAEPTDPPGPRILYANPAFLRTTGYTLDEVIGQTPRILQGADTDPAPREAIRKALKRWRPVVVELLNYRKDGSPFWVELSIVPVADPAGWYTHWVSIQRDITGRKQAEEALRAAKDEAEAANRAKSEFLSRMSHELRTPLNGILGFAQILQLDPRAAAHRDVVDDLYDGGKRLLALINEVLDISRVEAGGLPLSLEPVPLGPVIRDGLSLVAPLAARRAVVTSVDLPADAPDCLLADRQRLGQVLLNLLSNAIKYNREGGAVVVAVRAGAAGRVRVAVTDTGPGVAAGKVGRLFTPFDRLGAEATAVEGTGLGLALSKRLVEAMGGVIGADCPPGGGSTFWFELPACAAAPPAAADLSHHDIRLPTAGQHLVLYVEDNPANFRLIELALRHRPGVQLLAAMLGGLGVELATQHRPDLILLDLHLPDLPGEEVLRRLRGDPATRDIPVVVLSADATPGRAARLREAGAAHYLPKPLDIRQFLAVLDGVLPGPAAEGES